MEGFRSRNREGKAGNLGQFWAFFSRIGGRQNFSLSSAFSITSVKIMASKRSGKLRESH
jgi:hypothetical protein